VALLGLLADKETCARIGEAFREIHLQLRQNTAEKAAEAVLAALPAEVRENAVPAAA
jgi:lipid-A-disaccharide synthase